MHKLFEIPSFTLFLCAFCAFLWLKNPFNQRNPRLINDLRAFGIFTLVEKSLQINLFMQNKPNFRKSQMNVNKVLTKDYENETLSERGKNKAKTNPIRTQTNPIKANKMPKQSQNEPKTNPIKANFRGKNMLLRMTINTRRKSFGYRTLLRAFSSVAARKASTWSGLTWTKT